MSDNFRTLSGRARVYGKSIELVTKQRAIKGRVVNVDRSARFVAFSVRLVEAWS
jgi:hypothetical protein